MKSEPTRIDCELSQSRISRAVAELKAITTAQRAESLLGLISLLNANKEKLALAITKETGKPIYFRYGRMPGKEKT